MIIPNEQWYPCVPDLRSFAASRRPDWYGQVIDQFKPETSPRYAPANGLTYCNIFARDVMSAMDAPIPTGTINSVIALLRSKSVEGWRRGLPEEALQNANMGRPTLVTWANEMGHGHVAVVRPGASLMVANVGKTNFARGSVGQAFGTRPVEFWVHA